MMRTAFLWGLLVLLCQQALVKSYVLGRSYSTSDLSQLKNLLERFEQTLVAVAQAEDPASEYEGTNQDPDHNQASLGWDRAPEGQRPPPFVPQEPEEGHSRTQSQRNLLQDLLLATRSKTSGCFGGRLDRIGNSSNLGCNPTKG